MSQTVEISKPKKYFLFVKESGFGPVFYLAENKILFVLFCRAWFVPGRRKQREGY